MSSHRILTMNHNFKLTSIKSENREWQEYLDMKYGVPSLKILQGEAIVHYERMIDFALECIQRSIFNYTYEKFTDKHLMKLAIGENWMGSDCFYCRNLLIENSGFLDNGNISCIDIEKNECALCPLQGKTPYPPYSYFSSFCCDGRWWKMNMESTGTWFSWLMKAKKVLRYIKKHGDKKINRARI